MAIPFEAYVLSAERSRKYAMRFLSEFAPSRRPCADDFSFPQFVDNPEVIYDTPNDVIERLEQDRHESYGLYWKIEGEGIANLAMLFFTRDDGMIVGLEGPRVSPTTALFRLQRAVGGRYGYVTEADRPPDTISEFVAMSVRIDWVNIVDGVLRTHDPYWDR